MLSIKVKDALWRQKMCVECFYIYKSDFISILNPLFISMFTTMLACCSISWHLRLVKQCETVGRSVDRTYETKKNRNPLIKKPHHSSTRSLKLQGTFSN